MKALATAFSVLLAASVAFAQSSTTSPASGQQPGAGSTPAMGADKDKAKGSKEFKAEIVSLDADAKTITFKKTDPAAAATATPTTMTVDTSADLKNYKAGDHVKIVLKTDDTGKEVVKKIEKADARPAGDTPPNP